MSALIDLATPETAAARESINFIDLNTPVPVRGRTPVRATPKTSSKLLKKILDPRISMSTIESDFSDSQKNTAQSTPMANRMAAGPPQNCESPAIIELSDINESTEVSEQNNIISNSVQVACDDAILAEEVPETQPEDESIIDELFEDAEEVAQSDIGLCSVLDANPLQLSTSAVEVDENGDEYIPSTQAEQPVTDENSPAKQLATISEASESLSPPVTSEDILVESVASPEPHKEDDVTERDMEVRTFTPRKSLRTPKKIDHNQCCTPKSLSKVLLTETTQRRSPRMSRMNLSLRMDSAKSSTPVAVSKSLSKSLMVSKLMRSAKKTIVEISDESDSDAEEEAEQLNDGEEGVVVLADETVRQESPVLFADCTINNTRSELEKVFEEVSDAQSQPQPLHQVISEEDSVAHLIEEEHIERIEQSEEVTSTVTDTVLEEHDHDLQAEDDHVACSANVEEEVPTEPMDILEEESTEIDIPTEPTEDIIENVATEIIDEMEEELIENVATETIDEVEEIVLSETIAENVAPETIEDLGQESVERVDLETIEQLDEVLTETAPSEAIEAEPREVDIVEVAVPLDSVSAADNVKVIVEELYKSPIKTFRMEQENSPLKGSDSPRKTPKSKALAEEDSQRLTRSPLQNMSNMVGVRELFKTPKADVEKNLTGLREMMKTPQTVMHVTTNMVGIKEMMKTPGRLVNNDPNLTGMKEMLQTPKAKATENLVGLKEMVKTPAPKKQTNLVGLKELVNTPAQRKEANYVGIKELVNTPKPLQNPKLLGVREMLQTPKAKLNLKNTVGVKELFNTPQAAPEVNMVGVRELVQTPKPSTSSASEDISDMFKTPAAVPQGKRIVWEEQESLPEENEVAEEPEIEELPEEDKKSIEAIEKEELVLDTSAELFDKMMNRKSVPLKHTYSRQTPIKKEEKDREPSISPEKKEEVERWVESIIVASNGETKKIVNNNLQVMSDRYSNVTPSQAMKAESVLKVLQEEEADEVEEARQQEQQQNEPESKLSAAEVIVTMEEPQPLSTDDIEIAVSPSEEIVKEPTPPKETEDPAEPVEEEKPKRGRRAAQKLITEEVITPRTPLRTRRNLKVDLDDTPRASPRLRRAASLKLEESNAEVKVTPARRGRKPKVQKTVDEPVVVSEEPQADKEEQKPEEEPIEPENILPVVDEVQAEDTVAEPESVKPKKGGRPKAVKKVEEEKVVPSSSPVDDPVVVSEEPQAEKEEQKPEEDPVESEDALPVVDEGQSEGDPAEEAVAESESVKQKKGGRTKALKKLEEEEAAPSSTPQRRGRKPKAVEKLVEADAEVKSTPTRRGRKPAATKSVAEEETKKDEPTDTPAKRRGRAAPKRQAAVDEEKSPETEEKDDAPQADDAVTQEKTEETPAEKPVGRGRGRRAVAVAKIDDSSTTKVEEAPKAAASRGGRKKKAEEQQQQTSTEVEPTTESEQSAVEQRSETTTATEEEEEGDVLIEKPKPMRGRKGAAAAAVKKTAQTKRKVEEPIEGQKEDDKATPAKKGRTTKKEETAVKLADSEEEPALVKKPVRGRRAAALKHEESTTTANESVSSTPAARRGAKKTAASTPAVAKTDAVSEEVPKRGGRGKRAVATAESVDTIESPKRAKKQESNDTDEPPVEETVAEEQKPKRRGRAPKKAVSEDDSSVSSAASSKPTRGGRKAKVVVEEERPDEVEESEKETTADESSATVKVPARGKRTKMTSESVAETEEGEPIRKTRATRRKN